MKNWGKGRNASRNIDEEGKRRRWQEEFQLWSELLFMGVSLGITEGDKTEEWGQISLSASFIQFGDSSTSQGRSYNSWIILCLQCHVYDDELLNGSKLIILLHLMRPSVWNTKPDKNSHPPFLLVCDWLFCVVSFAWCSFNGWLVPFRVIRTSPLQLLRWPTRSPSLVSLSCLLPSTSTSTSTSPASEPGSMLQWLR